MTERISPFSHTPGIAGDAMIETYFANDIILNFESEASYKYVYKIVGLRGSGKSVEYSTVMNHFRKKSDWLVYALAADGRPLQTLISMLSMEKFIRSKKISSTIEARGAAAGNLGIVSGEAGLGAAINISDNEQFYSEEATLGAMLRQARENGYRVLIGVDDIAKTDEMVAFLSVLGAILMEPDKDVRFICTGTSKNIEDFVRVPHLSFFVRNESIKMKPLDLHKIAQKYRQLLGVTYEEAVALSQYTRGYAYGYQVLGEICFNMEKSEVDDEVAEAFDEMIGPQYDLIWSAFTEAEQELIRIIVNTDSGSVAEIKEKMDKESSFASLRDRLLKKHIIVSDRRGEVSVPLPRFREYVNLWH